MSARKHPEQIEREIEETREQLGDTVEALAQKADVRAQTKKKINETKTTVSEKTEHLRGRAREASPESVSRGVSQVSRKASKNPVPIAAIGAFAFGFMAGRLTGR